MKSSPTPPEPARLRIRTCAWNERRHLEFLCQQVTPARCLVGVLKVLLVTCLAVLRVEADTTHTIDLGGITVSQCGTPFTHGGLEMVFTNSAYGDRPIDQCFVSPFPNLIGLAPGYLEINLRSLSKSLLRIEADYSDGCGTGCTRLYVGKDAQWVGVATNTTGFVEGTLALDIPPAVIDSVILSTLEGWFYRLRLISAESPTPVVLRAEATGSDLRLTWPLDSRDCQLETATVLGTAMNWTPVLEPPVETPEGMQVRLVPSDSPVWFRLKCP